MRIKCVIIIISASAIWSIGCQKEGAPTDPHPFIDELPISERTFKIGTSGLVPRHWPDSDGDDWQDLFNKLPEYGELFGIHTGWNEGELDGDGVPIVIQIAYDVTEGKTIVPYIAVGVEPENLTDEEADTYFDVHGEDFFNLCIIIAEMYTPGIFIIGIEINRFYEKSPSGFQDFVALYRQLYDEIKELNGGTKVGSNFLLEYMRGGGALSGQPHEEHWYILDLFADKSDLTTFTLFPFLDYNHPSAIPSDYFHTISQYTDLPVMVTETGWPSEPIAGIDGSEEAQVDYLITLLEGTIGMQVEALIWVFPHDPETGEAGGIFDHVSLRRNNGSDKPVFEYWQALKSLPFK